MIQDNPMSWPSDLRGSEHPDTARLRLGKETIDQMLAMKREGMDKIYIYINELVDKAKEELQHARSASNPPKLENGGQGARIYVLDDVSSFFGQVRCVVDQWHADHLAKVVKEITILQYMQERNTRKRKAAP